MMMAAYAVQLDKFDSYLEHANRSGSKVSQEQKVGRLWLPQPPLLLRPCNNNQDNIISPNPGCNNCRDKALVKL